MFFNCSSLLYANISEWDMENASDISYFKIIARFIKMGCKKCDKY